MTADTTSHLVPKLRFPEFQRAGNWKRDQIGNVASITKGKRVSKGDLTKDGATPCIRYAELYTHYGEVIHDVVSGTNVPHEDLMLSQAEDVIVPASGETRVDIARAACVLPERVALGSDLNILRSDLYGPFFSYLLNSPLRHIIARMAQGDTVAHLYPKQLSQVWLAYPLRFEQQKIADCLGSLDDLIAAEDRKLEALRQHKQGLMQQFFPQPGETVPRLRFPEFSEEGAWEETTIGDMGEVITGNTPSTSRRDFYGGDFMFVSPADISGLRFVEETKTTLTEAGFAECRPIKKNSVLFVCIGSTIGKVAQCPRPCATNQQINSLVASPAFFAGFAYYLLDRESVRIAKLAGRQAVPIINKSSFATVKVTAPLIAEQQRIADCLSSLDARLASQVKKISVLKTHKQGLLQQLFPSLEANRA